MKEVERLLNGGFYHNNLVKMADLCSREVDTPKLLVAFVLHHIFFELAEMIANQPTQILKNKIEMKYRNKIEFILKDYESKTALQEQVNALLDLIRLHWYN